MKIKKGFKAKYKQYLINNINSIFKEEKPFRRKDGKMVTMPQMPTTYIMAILFVTELVGEALDDGQTPAEAEKQIEGHDLTGFMAGAVAETLAWAHPRGDEFRKYWNQSFGIKPEDDKGGVVNPAIVSIGRDIKKGKKVD